MKLLRKRYRLTSLLLAGMVGFIVGAGLIFWHEVFPLQMSKGYELSIRQSYNKQLSASNPGVTCTEVDLTPQSPGHYAGEVLFSSGQKQDITVDIQPDGGIKWVPGAITTTASAPAPAAPASP
jgi:hypothetical protein